MKAAKDGRRILMIQLTKKTYCPRTKTHEVGTLKALINIDHIEYDRWSAFCTSNLQKIEGEEWRELATCHYRENHWQQEPKSQVSEKAKALWAMKAAKDSEDEFYALSPQRTHSGKETDKNWQLW